MTPITKENQNIKASTGKNNEAIIKNSSMEILVGGSYIKDGQDYPYGHLALRVNTQGKEYVYDYGRYGKKWGTGGSEGEGIIRIWSKFNAYIKSENVLGRTTTGFVFSITDKDADKVIEHFKLFIENSKITDRKKYVVYYITTHDYHALNSNCTTVAFDGARHARSDIDIEQKKYIEGRGLDLTEKLAARFDGWPNRIFMPADVEEMMKNRSISSPEKVNVYKQ